MDMRAIKRKLTGFSSTSSSTCLLLFSIPFIIDKSAYFQSFCAFYKTNPQLLLLEGRRVAVAIKPVATDFSADATARMPLASLGYGVGGGLLGGGVRGGLLGDGVGGGLQSFKVTHQPQE